jgi:perosamine synthetase
MIPYGKQYIDEDDILSVVEVLRSGCITNGTKLNEFEKAFAKRVGTKYAIALSSGTAALHAAMYAIDISVGNEVIIPPITFAASANCIVYQGGVPIFSDIEPETLLIDPNLITSKITKNTKAILAVDYAGQPCDYESLKRIARDHNLILVADACHSLGAVYKGQKVGSIADLSIFSFHPVKHITTGEGGMVTTNNQDYASRIKYFRNHGITTDYRQREKKGQLFYEMTDLGYNYRITEFQCALGISQLKKLNDFLNHRFRIAAQYNRYFKDIQEIVPLGLREDVLIPDESAKCISKYKCEKSECGEINANELELFYRRSVHAYHLYVIKIKSNKTNIDRDYLVKVLRNKKIGANVHYKPVYLHPFYISNFKTHQGLCPKAENTFKHIISLPVFPEMSDNDVKYVVNTLKNSIFDYRKTGCL